ncbi:uncharacterized protein LOC142173612 [Nicotiana tabacum]|uniref:Uncharacterized protein LOC142173612 n=1 Tax=Nicotiana tabacum TaxID=4097 RepID=A0AC58TDP5_TOBAC
MDGNEISSLDHNHLLFLQVGDAPVLVLIPLKLTEPENYALWSRAMKLALRGKSKLGFVDGTCVKSNYRGELAEQWEKCNAIVLSWIGSTISSELMSSIVYVSNAKKVWNDFQERFDRSNITRIYHLWTAIVTLRQGTDLITSYYSKMKDLRDELDVLAPLSSRDYEESRPSVDHLKNIRLLQFLIGLNESYSNIHNNVLAKRLVVTVNEAYAIRSAYNASRKGQDFRPRKLGLICEYCGYKGHLKENCFKIIGYPPDFKSKKKNQTSGGNAYANSANANATNAKEERVMSAIQAPGQFFIEEQYKQLVSLLSKPNADDCYANMSGIIALLSTATMCDWVIDSGATHHVTYCKDVLRNIKNADNQGLHGVQLPTGNKSKITRIGNATILQNKTVKNDLYSGRVMEIDKENNGLYVLKENITLAAT